MMIIIKIIHIYYMIQMNIYVIMKKMNHSYQHYLMIQKKYKKVSVKLMQKH